MLRKKGWIENTIIFFISDSQNIPTLKRVFRFKG